MVKYEGMTYEELEAIVRDASAALNAKKDARRAELMAELEKLGGVAIAKPRAPRAPRAEGDDGRASPKPLYRSPSGITWSGRGAMPRWAKDLGITDKAELEKYRISE